MVKKINKQVVNIDIYSAKTQSGKTTHYINEIIKHPEEDAVVALPRRVVVMNEIVHRFHLGMKKKRRSNYEIYNSHELKVFSTVELVNIKLRNRANSIQTIFVLMGDQDLDELHIWKAITYYDIKGKI